LALGGYGGFVAGGDVGTGDFGAVEGVGEVAVEGGGVAGLDGCFGGVEAGGEGEVAGTAGRGPAGEGEGLGGEVGVRGERDGDSVLAGLAAGEGEERAGGEAEGSFIVRVDTGAVGEMFRGFGICRERLLYYSSCAYLPFVLLRVF